MIPQRVKMLRERKEKTVKVVVEIPVYMIKDTDEYGYEILMLVEEKLGIKAKKKLTQGC